MLALDTRRERLVRSDDERQCDQVSDTDEETHRNHDTQTDCVEHASYPVW